MNNQICKTALAIAVLSVYGCASTPIDTESSLADSQKTSANEAWKVVGENGPSQDEGTESPLEQNLGGFRTDVIAIHRRGPGYDIKYNIDLSNDEVSFIMDLPSDGKNSIFGLNPEKISSNTAAEQDDSDQLGGNQTDESATSAEKPKESETAQLASKYIISAQTLFYKDLFRAAMTEVDKAIDISPDVAIAHALKGSIHYRMGNRQQAAVSWEKALILDPEMEDIRVSLRQLES